MGRQNSVGNALDLNPKLHFTLQVWESGEGGYSNIYSQFFLSLQFFSSYLLKFKVNTESNFCFDVLKIPKILKSQYYSF